MDDLQRQHAFDKIEMHAKELKLIATISLQQRHHMDQIELHYNEIKADSLAGFSDNVNALEGELDDLTRENERKDDRIDELEDESKDLYKCISVAINQLNDLMEKYSDDDTLQSDIDEIIQTLRQ